MQLRAPSTSAHTQLQRKYHIIQTMKTNAYRKPKSYMYVATMEIKTGKNFLAILYLYAL